MKQLAKILSVLLVLFVLVVVLLPITATGTRVLINLVSRFAPLEIDYGGGRLAGQMNLHRFTLQAESVMVEVRDINSDFDASCIWRSTLCFRSLRAQHLAVTATPSSRGDRQTAPDVMVEFPVQLEARQLSIASTDIRWPGGSWQHGELNATVGLSGSTIHVASAQVGGALLLVEPSEKSAAGFQPPPIRLPLVLLVDQLQLSAPHTDIAGQQTQLEQLSLSGRWSGTHLELAQSELQSSELGALALAGEIDFEGDWPVQATGHYRAGSLGEDPQLLQRQLDLAFAGDFAGLGVQVKSVAAVNMALDGEVNLTAAGLPFSGGVVMDWPGELSLDQLLAVPAQMQGLQLQAPFKGQVSGNLESQSFDFLAVVSGLGYEQLQLQMTGSHRAQVIELSRLSFADAGSDSELTASGQLQFDRSPRLDLSLQSTGFNLPSSSQYLRGRLAGGLKSSVSLDAENWSVQVTDVDLNGEVNGLPATLSGFGGIAAGLRLGAGDFLAQVNGARVEYHNSGDATDTAQLRVVIENLSRWQPDIRGSARLLLQRDSGGEQLQLSADLRQAQWNGLEVGSVTLEGNYHVPEQQFMLDLQAEQTTSPGMGFERLRLRLQGNPAAHSMQLTSGGDLSGELVIHGQWRSDEWRGELAPTRLHSATGPWLLNEPVALLWQRPSSQLSLAAHCWQHSGLSFCPADTKLGADGQASMALNGDISALNRLIGQDLQLQGELQMDLQASWLPGTPLQLLGNGSARSVEITRSYGLGEAVSISLESMQLALTGGEQGLDLSGEVYNFGRRTLSFSAKLPTSKEGPLQGEVELDGMQLAALAPWTPELSTLEGRLSGELLLSGTIADPQVVGAVHLEGGHLALLGNPTQLTDLEALLQLQGDSGTLTGKGLLGGGELQVRGNLASAPDWRLQIDAKGLRHQILVPPSTELLVSEELALVITPGLLDVSGDINIHEGAVRHEELPEGSVAVSPDVVEVDYAGNAIRAEKPWKIRSDVLIHLRDRLEVRGDSLHATLGGELHLQQKLDRPPQLFGTLNIRGGELRAYKQQLQIRRGTVAFTGPPDNPELDIRAERKIPADNITAGARLSGTLDAPVLQVYSDPVMSQGEAMSYLVRGRGLDTGAGADGTALALAVGTDVVNQSGIVSEINRLPGISNVAFGSSGDDDDTAATVSGYLGERIYLSYGIGVYEPINVLTARLYLNTRLWLEVVSRLENAVDLYYSFDIE